MLVLVLRSVFLIMFCSSSTLGIKIMLVVTSSFQGFRPSLLQVPCPFHCITGLSLILIFPLRLCDVSVFCISASYPCVFFLQHGCSYFACFGLLRFLECFLRLNGSAGVLLLLVLFGVSVCCPGLFYVCCVFIRAFRFFVCS